MQIAKELAAAAEELISIKGTDFRAWLQYQ